MTQSITTYVDVSATLDGIGPQQAGFGDAMFVTESAVLSPARQLGPYTSRTGVQTAGFAVNSAADLFAASFFEQNPRARNLYIGRADAGDADLAASLAAIYAAAPATGFCWAIENRTAAEILMFRSFLAGKFKIGVAQCNDPSMISATIGQVYTATIGGTPEDGDYEITFDGLGLGAPVTITVARLTTPATNDDLATQMAADITTAIGTSLAGVVVSATANTNVVTISFVVGLEEADLTESSPGSTTITLAATDVDIAQRLFDLQSTNLALIYNPSDSEYSDAAWAARCLSFDLDVRAGVWSYKPLSGITGTSLTDAQVTALRNRNVNYFGPAVPSSGVATQSFTAQGWFPFGTAAAGRRIDVTTSIFWAKARLEEALMGVLLRETHKIAYTDAGIGRFVAAVQGVLDRGVAAGHFDNGRVVPDTDEFAGLVTPAIIAPRRSEVSAADAEARILRFQAVVYLAGAIEKVVFNLNVKQS